MKMNLEDLVGKNLDRVAPAAETIRRLLDSAARHIADAKVTAISAELRFVSAYTAIRTLADAGSMPMDTAREAVFRGII